MPSVSVTFSVTDVPDAMSTVQVYEVDSVEDERVSSAADETSPPGMTALQVRDASGETMWGLAECMARYRQTRTTRPVLALATVFGQD